MSEVGLNVSFESDNYAQISIVTYSSIEILRVLESCAVNDLAVLNK